jgi:hypothetical protein
MNVSLSKYGSKKKKKKYPCCTSDIDDKVYAARRGVLSAGSRGDSVFGAFFLLRSFSFDDMSLLVCPLGTKSPRNAHEAKSRRGQGSAVPRHPALKKKKQRVMCWGREGRDQNRERGGDTAQRKVSKDERQRSNYSNRDQRL